MDPLSCLAPRPFARPALLVGAALAAALTAAGPVAAQTVSTLPLSQALETDGAMLDGNTLYVTEGFSGDEIHAIDVTTGQVSLALSGIDGPIDVAKDAQGLLYATNWNSNTISRGPEGGVAAPWSTVGQNPDGLLFDSSGTLWCTLGSRHRIKTVASDGTVTLLVGPGNTSYPLGIAEGPDGNMYIGGLYNGVVYRVTPAGDVDSLATVPGTGQFRIGHLEIAQGVIYASGLSDHVIWRITLAGEVSLFAGTQGVPGTDDGPVATATFTSPIGLAASADGTKLYVTRTFSAVSSVRVIDLSAGTDAPALGAGAAAGSGATLTSVSPNPFVAVTRVELSLPAAGPVEVEVFGVDGRRVRSVLSGRLPAGRHVAAWDGRTERGAAAPAGVYYLRLRTETGDDTRRVVRVR